LHFLDQSDNHKKCHSEALNGPSSVRLWCANLAEQTNTATYTSIVIPAYLLTERTGEYCGIFREAGELRLKIRCGACLLYRWRKRARWFSMPSNYSNYGLRMDLISGRKLLILKNLPAWLSGRALASHTTPFQKFLDQATIRNYLFEE
jgi:hypothetical protein